MLEEWTGKPDTVGVPREGEHEVHSLATFFLISVQMPASMQFLLISIFLLLQVGITNAYARIHNPMLTSFSRVPRRHCRTASGEASPRWTERVLVLAGHARAAHHETHKDSVLLSIIHTQSHTTGHAGTNDLPSHEFGDGLGAEDAGQLAGENAVHVRLDFLIPGDGHALLEGLPSVGSRGAR